MTVVDVESVEPVDVLEVVEFEAVEVAAEVVDDEPPATALEVAADVPVLFAGLCNPVPPCGPVSVAAPVPPADEKIGSIATLSGSVTSPRTSTDVSRSEPYAMPPGARTLLLEIDVTMSPSVNCVASSLCGSTSTWIDGVTVPPALTFETPSTCSISGTILLVTIAESSACVSDVEVTEYVATTVCAGSNDPIVGAVRSVGRTERVDSTRRWTSTRSLV